MILGSKTSVSAMKKEKYLQGSDLENVSRSNRFLGKQEKKESQLRADKLGHFGSNSSGIKWYKGLTNKPNGALIYMFISETIHCLPLAATKTSLDITFHVIFSVCFEARYTFIIILQSLQKFSDPFESIRSSIWLQKH